MKQILVLIVAALLLLPNSFVLSQTWQACPTGSLACTSGLFGTNLQNQVTGTTLSTPSASTGVPGTVGGYVPLEPIYNQWGGNRFNSFSDYLKTLYKLAITVGAITAVVMLVTSGIRYMLSESFTDIDKAKARIKNSLWGLVIVVGSFLILYTINPNLLSFSLLLPAVNQKPSNFTVATGGSSGSASSGTPIPGYPGVTTGSASGDELRQANQLLNTKLVDSQYVLLNPTQLSSAQLNALIDSYLEYCQQSGFVYNVSLGYSHYYARAVPGQTFGGPPGSSAMVCANSPDNP